MNIPYATIGTGIGILAAVVSAVLAILDRIRSRSRFGVTTGMDEEQNAWVEIVNKGRAPGYVQIVRIVVVKSRLYVLLRKLRYNDQISPTSLLVLNTPAQPLQENQPFLDMGKLPEQWLLPPRRNPFGSVKGRVPTRGEMRAQVKFSNRKKFVYMRLKQEKGRQVSAQPKVAAPPEITSSEGTQTAPLPGGDEPPTITS